MMVNSYYWAIYITTPSCDPHLSCTPNSFPTSVLPLRPAQFAHLYPNRRNPHVTDKWVPPHRKYIHRGVSLTSGPHKNYHSPRPAAAPARLLQSRQLGFAVAPAGGPRRPDQVVPDNACGVALRLPSAQARPPASAASIRSR